MSDPTSIFNQENPGENLTNPDLSKVTAPNEAELTDLLGSIKNERGEPKYKTLKDALIGLQHAQTYIPELKGNLTDKERELEEMRARAEKVADLEKTIRDLTDRPNPDGTPPKGITEQEIADIVNRSIATTLTAKEQQLVQTQNITTVVDAMKETFGTDAEKKFYEKATELGMSVAEFNALAAKSPKMVLGVLGVTSKPNTKGFTPTQGTINSQAFTPRSDTFIGRNNKTALIGATTQEVMEESKNSKNMVEELHKSGKSVSDLSNPKEYFKLFGKT